MKFHFGYEFIVFENKQRYGPTNFINVCTYIYLYIFIDMTFSVFKYKNFNQKKK